MGKWEELSLQVPQTEWHFRPGSPEHVSARVASHVSGSSNDEAIPQG